MASIDILLPFIFSWEGGYSNNKYDSGKQTCKGVTIGTFTKWRKHIHKGSTATIENLKAITDEEVRDICKWWYWDKCRADEIVDQSVANMIVDWNWMSGVWAIKHTQRILGVDDDGIIGPITLNAINSYFDAETLFNLVWNERKAYYGRVVKSSPYKEGFYRGWIRRLNAMGYGWYRDRDWKLTKF